MPGFFKIKLYRNKFIIFGIIVFTLAAVFCIFTCHLFMLGWYESARTEGTAAFERAEVSIGAGIDKAEAYMQRLYSIEPLMSDLQSFLGNNAEGYLTKRLKNNSGGSILFSFPNDIQSFLGGENSIITRVSLHTDDTGNILSFSPDGNRDVVFGVSNDSAAFVPGIHNEISYIKGISDPTRISRQIGEVRFWISSKRVFKPLSAYSMDKAAVIDMNGNIFRISENTPDEHILELVLGEEADYGSLPGGLFNAIRYVKHESALLNYIFISYTDTKTVIRTHLSILLFICFAFVATGLCVVFLIAYNFVYEARFLAHIMQVIDHVKQGNFNQVTLPRYRRDEYGMIAKELDDMTRQLEQHIKKEYLLQLKQKETEMKALQQQINPHFLYNTLEAMRSMALTSQNPKALASAITCLGGLYRELVKAPGIITIDEELTLLHKYLRIMEFKYPDSFFDQISVDSEVRALKTVKFWMQPLAENFFVHGFKHGNAFNLLVINGYTDDEAYIIEILDNGSDIPPDQLDELNASLTGDQQNQSGDIGLSNVYTRLRFYYGEALSMTVSNNEEAGIKISVRIRKQVLNV